MERADKQSLISQAYAYNDKARTAGSCNQLYMGSMASYNLVCALGAVPFKTPLSQAIEDASDEQLDAGLAVCHNIIRHGRLIP